MKRNYLVTPPKLGFKYRTIINLETCIEGDAFACSVGYVGGIGYLFEISINLQKNKNQ